jgi:hypothetical protein
MQLEPRTPDALRNTAIERVSRLPQVLKGRIKVFVPVPQRRAPDPNGCNWDIQNCAPRVVQDEVDRIITKMKSEFRLV